MNLWQKIKSHPALAIAGGILIFYGVRNYIRNKQLAAANAKLVQLSAAATAAENTPDAQAAQAAYEAFMLANGL